MKVIEEYTTKYPQKFVKVDGISTGGAKKNFFYLLSCVDAPYLMCCDQDDVWLPEKVEVTFQAMKQLEQKHADRKRDTTACIYGTSCCGRKAEYDCGEDECVSAAGM